MLFIDQVGAAFLLVTLTLCLQSAGIAALLAWVRQVTEGYVHKLGPFRVAVLFVRVMTAIIALHTLEILLWASCYRWLCLPSWESASYFSASSYATVGYGDVVLPKTWRMLGPLESIVGVLMCGLSVSVLFAIATRLAGRER
jgi:voltage-gated potassium channel